MQSLCPALAGILCLAGVFSPALTPPASAQDKPAQVAASTPWPAAATPAQALSQAVSGWLGVQQGVDPSGIQLAPLDSRLQIKPCPAGLRLDFPFASQETVRVRCEAPTWQLFVRVMSPSPAVRPKVAGSSVEEKPVILRKVVVASGLLQRGSRLSADQISLVEVPANGLPANVLDRIDDAVNAELIRDVPAGVPLRSHDIRPALMIKRGQSVMVSAGSASGFKVMARLEAMQDGRMGEQIKLRNKESGRQISAVVTGLNAADAL